MKQIKLKNEAGEVMEFAVKSEWSDWTFAEFKQLFETLSAMPETIRKKITDPSAECSNTEAIEVNFSLMALLKDYSNIPEHLIIDMVKQDCMDIIEDTFLSQIMACMYPQMFGEKPDLKLQNGQPAFGFAANPDFEARNFTDVFQARIPAPEMKIVSLAQALEYELSIEREFAKDRDAVLGFQGGKIEALPRIAAIYEVQPYDDKKIEAETIRNESRNMQELLDFFYYTRNALRSLGISRKFSITRAKEMETANNNIAATTT